MTVRARFDDLRPGRVRSFSLSGMEAELVADRPADVPGVLADAAAAASTGRWVAGYLAYEAAPGLDPHLTVVASEAPLAWFGVFAGRGPAEPLAETAGAYQLGAWRPSVDGPGYERDVAAIRELIAAGDTYQVNYSMRIAAPFAGDAPALYRDLALAQSAGYGAYLDTGRHVVASASPELFFEWDGDEVATRPMKGTAPRGRWAAEDDQRRRELLASEKDRAENLMIVDLIRNDLGRVARFGTVVTESLFDAERFDTVWQLTSTVRARTRPDTGLADMFAALFPCGSVTGAPKVRTMEIIADLERVPRGVYCGAVGFVEPGGRAAFNVAIRTIEIDREAGTATYGVGGGVTWDSTPAGEHREALLKADVLARARMPFELLETMRWDPVDGWWWRDLHLRRLGESAEHFGIPMDPAAVAEALDGAVGGDQPLRVRLTVDRRGVPAVAAAPAPPVGDPVAVAVDDQPVDRDDPFLYHKTTRRAVYAAARARHPEAEDVLLVNDRGEVTESTTANVVAQVGGVWVTPPIAAGCLPGVQRQALLDRGEITERPLPVADLLAAERVALVNSVRGWMSARLLRPVSRAAPRNRPR